MTTIHDVAKSAGVSPITVSRVVNRLENVNPKTRARVEKAIGELGYVRNLAARSLRSRESFTLALILPDITNTFWTTVARGVEDAAQGGGYSVLLCNTDENPDKFTAYLTTVLQQRVDGVLLAPVTNDSLQFAQLGTMKVPTVVIDRRVPGWEGDSVYCDSVAGSQALVQHLLSLGHTRIAIISGPATTSTAEDRVAGYYLALYKAGLPVDQRLVWRGEYRVSSGRGMTRALLESGPAPTAIVATNNAIAAGVLEELKSKGMNVPGNMAVVCFDEIPEMERFFPFLTSVSQPAYDMGINATQLLLSRIGARNSIRARQVVLPTRLILRYSCGRFLKSGKPEADVNFTVFPDLSTNQLVKPLDDADRELLLMNVPGFSSDEQPGESDPYNTKSDRERLTTVLAFGKTERLSYVDGRGSGKRVMEYVLGRALRQASDGLNILPEDTIEFAQQLGIDAVACDISWPMGAVDYIVDEDFSAKARRAYPPPPLATQLNVLENLLRAAEGTGVGVYSRFSSFFEPMLTVAQVAMPADDLRTFILQGKRLEKLMDMLVKQQGRVIRAVCDRFGHDLCFVSIQDDFLTRPEFVADVNLFQNVILPRLERMITPARDHGLPIALDTTAAVEAALPDLYRIGIRIIQAANSQVNDLDYLARTWHGKLAFIGGIPASMLAKPFKDEIDEGIRKLCQRYSSQSGFVLSIDRYSEVDEKFSPQNFVTAFRAIKRYGCA